MNAQIPYYEADLIGATTEIVVAAINNSGNSALSVLQNDTTHMIDIPALIANTHAALVAIAQPKPTAEAPPQEPAVSIRASVKPDSVTCLECGFSGKMLKRHLQTEHGLLTGEYLAKWHLKADHPLTAPSYSVQRRELAMSIGLGRKPAPEPVPAPVAKRSRKAG